MVSFRKFNALLWFHFWIDTEQQANKENANQIYIKKKPIYVNYNKQFENASAIVRREKMRK